MIRPVELNRSLRTDLARDSNRRVVEIVLHWGLGTAAVLTLIAAGIGIVMANRDARHQSDEFHSLVSALVQSDISPAERQRILLSYQGDRYEEDGEGVLSLLLLNSDGQIALSTRSSWVGRQLSPDRLTPAIARDPQLSRIASCFARQSRDRSACFSASEDLFLPWSRSLTLARPFRVYDRRFALKPRDYLMVVSFDPGVFTSKLTVELGLVVLSIGLLVVVLGALLARQLQRGLLPNLQQFAETDGLTGLMNRSAFMDLAVQLLGQGQSQGLSYVLGVIDIDHFKAINDGHGHICGDEVLQKLARVLDGSLREGDLVTRLGGEEFAVLLQTTATRGEMLMERLRSQVEISRLSFEGRPLQATVSIGAASTELLGYNLDYLYSSADAALFRAKREGRNRVRWATTRRDVVERHDWSPGEVWQQTFMPRSDRGPGPAGDPVPGPGREPSLPPIKAGVPPRLDP